MNAVNEILNQVPVDQLAAEVGAAPDQTRAAAGEVIETLIRGMSANAEDPRGERSLAEAIDQHASRDLLGGGVDLARVDTADGEQIVHHVFGQQTDPVIATLGKASPSASPDLVRRLLPILAPIVLSYLAKRLSGGNSPYGDILGQVLAGAAGQAGRSGGAGGGLSLPDILGQVLGGGFGGQEPQQPAPRQAPQQPAPQQPGFPGPQGPVAGDQPATIDVDEPAGPTGQAAPQSPRGGLGGDILAEILKGMLGGGRRA